jgi:hypothetical protein
VTAQVAIKAGMLVTDITGTVMKAEGMGMVTERIGISGADRPYHEQS